MQPPSGLSLVIHASIVILRQFRIIFFSILKFFGFKKPEPAILQKILNRPVISTISSLIIVSAVSIIIFTSILALIKIEIVNSSNFIILERVLEKSGFFEIFSKI